MRRLRWFLLIGCCFLVGFSGYRWYLHAQAEETIEVKPFVAELADYYVDGKTGRETVTTRYILARRSDAAQARIGIMYDNKMPGGSYNIRRIDDPHGFVAMISDKLRLMSSGKRPDTSLAAHKQGLLHPLPECHGGPEVLAGVDDMFGAKAYRIVTTSTDDLQRITSWRLADYNCAAIGGLIEKRGSTASPWRVEIGSHVLSFAGQQPKPDLFTVAADYREVRPSDMHAKLLESAGVTKASCPKCFDSAARADANYDAWHR